MSEPVDIGENVRHHLDVFGTVDKTAPLQRVEREVVPCGRKHPTAYPREYRPILVVPIHHHYGKPQLRNLPNQRGRCRRLPSACHPEYRDVLSKVLDAEPELVELSPTGPYISQEKPPPPRLRGVRKVELRRHAASRHHRVPGLESLQTAHDRGVSDLRQLRLAG